MDGSYCTLCALEASSSFLQWFDQRWALQVLLPLQLLSSRLVFCFLFYLNPSQLFSPPSCVWLNLHPTTSSHKTFSLKRFWVKIQKQSCPIPHWIQMKPGNKIRYTSERRHWRRTKLGLQEASHRKCTHLYCVKAWLIWEDPDAGRDWGQEEKGTTENEMVGWHHQLNGHGFGWTPGVGDGQGGLACCSSWGCKESDTTEQLNWTELT